jgi:hypothetical protein
LTSSGFSLSENYVNHSDAEYRYARTFEDTLAAFLRSLKGAKLSVATLRDHATDFAQCLDYLRQTRHDARGLAEIYVGGTGDARGLRAFTGSSSIT